MNAGCYSEWTPFRITNRAKDFFVEQLQQERDGFSDQLLSATRKEGELETRLLHLEGPNKASGASRGSLSGEDNPK